MKAPKNAKGLALVVAGVVVAAGAVAVDLPALANTNKSKPAATKTVKAKSTAVKQSVKAGTTTSPTVPPAPPVGDRDGDGPRGFGHGDPQVLTSVLADLVSKGTITQAQSDAITAALQAKRDAAEKAENDFREKATGIIAGVLGLTVDEFNAKRADRTLPEPTDAQRTEIKTKLDALRTSLGLPMGGPGMDHHGGPGMGGRGDGGPGMGGRGDGDGDGGTGGPGGPGMGGMGMGGPGMGMRGHHGGRGF